MAWRKSRHSGAHSHCVEAAVGRARERVLLRDSKDPAGPVLAFSPTGWKAFVRDIKAGGPGAP